MTELCMVNDYIESLFIKVSNDAMTLVIGLIYRPPNSNIARYTKTLNDILGQVSHMPCYIMGDYNIDLLKHDLHPPTEKFLEAMYSKSLSPMILKLSRETATATLWDYVFTNKYSIDKNKERHTAHTIVSWPNPKQWVIVHTSDLIVIIRQSICILSIITRKKGKLKTHSPTYCKMDNWENMLNLTHTLDKIYLTGIL